jgi:hypothetical protein
MPRGSDAAGDGQFANLGGYLEQMIWSLSVSLNIDVTNLVVLVLAIWATNLRG